MARRSRGSIDKQRTDHPTGRQIAVAVAEILKDKGPAEFHVDDVLERTGLTRGAIYHHFDNVDDLIESGLLITYTEGVDANISFVRDVLAAAETFEEFRSGIFRANRAYARDRGLRSVRILRAHALSLADRSERMATLLAAAQQRVTDEYVGAIARAQSAGWIRPTIDPRALAVFVQAYSFGVIVDDVADIHLDPEAWATVIEEFFDGTVFIPDRT